jgi:hypothetical protein
MGPSASDWRLFGGPTRLLSAMVLAVFLLHEAASRGQRDNAPALRAAAAVRAASSALSTKAPWAETIADGCQHVYLDLGSNVGIQVRKLFEPELFPDAAGDSIAVFNRFFGSAAERRKSTCAIGLEMNPTHTSRLKALEAAYAQQGWRTRFFTQTAVGVDFSTGHYDHTGVKDTPLDLSAKINFATAPGGDDAKAAADPGLGSGGEGDFSIRFASAAELILLVAARRLPSSGEAAHIVAKLDIEGGEHLVLPHLLLSNALCALNYLALEMHPKTLLLELSIAKLAQTGCKTEVSLDDDEKYAFSSFPLPPPPPV